MSNFVIICDSTCDFIRPLRERFNVPAFVPGIIYHPDGHESFADMDWEETNPDEYYNSMKGGKVLYKTATPTQGKIIEVLEPFLKDGKDILFVTLSSALSGTIQVVRNTAAVLLEKYPERKIICIDSLRYASATAVLLVQLAKKRDEGATIEETADFANTIKHSVHQMGPLDDLFFCVKTGRLANHKAFFGTLIGLNCLGDFNRGGLTEVIGKVKGKMGALEATVRYVKETIVNPEEQIVFVAHSARREAAEILAEKIRTEIKPKEVIINNISMSCGAGIGPGLCAAYYLGSPVSENLEKEKEIMDNVIKNLKK